MRMLPRLVPPVLALAMLFSAGEAHAIKLKWLGGGKGRQTNNPPKLSRQDRDTITQIHFLARQNDPSSAQLALDQARELVRKAGTNPMVCKAGMCAVESAVQLDLATVRSLHAPPNAQKVAQQRLDAWKAPGILEQWVGMPEAQRVRSTANNVRKISKPLQASQPGDTLILHLADKL